MIYRYILLKLYKMLPINPEYVFNKSNKIHMNNILINDYS